jgi:hypothetical protein
MKIGARGIFWGRELVAERIGGAEVECQGREGLGARSRCVSCSRIVYRTWERRTDLLARRWTCWYHERVGRGTRGMCSSAAELLL